MSIQYPSVSYPYLAVAHKHQIPYGEVLAFVDQLDSTSYTHVDDYNRFPDWKKDAFTVRGREMERRAHDLDP